MSFLDTERRGIASAAVAVDYFERTHIFDNRAVFRLGSELQEHLQRHGGLTFEAIKYTTTVRNYTVENAVLDADTLLLMKDGLTIQETAYFVPGDSSNRPSIDNDALVRLPEGESVIVGYNNAHPGYQHWLTQCVPAIDWSLRQCGTRRVRLLLPALQPWQEDFIRFLGHGSVVRLTPEAGQQYLLPRVEWSEFLNGSTSFSVCLSMLDTARRILRAVPSRASVHRVIYVPCANPYYGPVVNEDEVRALLRLRGVHVVDQALPDTAERINLFRNADVIMGPHGQGLTDVIFCKPGAVLWEWMPRQYQNAVFNRLAQAAGVDYRGDLFENVADPPGGWVVDVARVAAGLAELADHLAVKGAGAEGEPGASDAGSRGSSAPDDRPSADAQPLADARAWASAKASANAKPIDELMLAFESLGANCEFGLVQRHAGVEPLGLLRFAAMAIPDAIRIERLVDALLRGFEGLGAVDTIAVYLPDEPGRREFLARESVYNLQYHTGMYSDEIAADALQRREVTRLTFLRRKLQEDLRTGEKIWVWQCASTTGADQVLPLLHALRALGPNTLVWVVECDDDHPPGTAERLERDFIKGYVEHFAAYESALDLSAFSWIGMCQSAYDLCRPEAATAAAEPAEVEPPRALSAMEFLARHPASVWVEPEPAAAAANGSIGRRRSLRDVVARIWVRR
jgi:capsular polysaccharide biosynthesis protein